VVKDVENTFDFIVRAFDIQHRLKGGMSRHFVSIDIKSRSDLWSVFHLVEVYISLCAVMINHKSVLHIGECVVLGALELLARGGTELTRVLVQQRPAQTPGILCAIVDNRTRKYLSQLSE